MLRRARTITELQDALSRFVTPEGIRYALAFRPRSSDVLIATYPKAGTTWMQQIVHGLRSHGDMSFEEITEVTPWIELALDLGWDLEADQVAAPRAFKTHRDAHQVPAGCRYIVVLRDPYDTVFSFYDFLNGWILERDSVSIDDFAAYLAFRQHPSSDYWTHLASWWDRRDDPSVLLTTFEDMRQDLEGNVRRVSRFMGLGEDEARIEIATRQSQFSFMKAHESQFDEHQIAAARNVAAGIPADARTTKVNKGEVAGSSRSDQSLSPATRAMLQERWDAIALKRTGCASYSELLDALRSRASDHASL